MVQSLTLSWPCQLRQRTAIRGRREELGGPVALWWTMRFEEGDHRSDRCSASGPRHCPGHLHWAETDHPRRHVEVHQLYFATQEEGQEWLHAILKARACQAYTNACLKLKAQPLIPIFSLLLNPSLDTLDLHDVFIGRPATRAIAAFGQLIADDMAAAALAAKSIDNFHPPSSFRTGGLALQHVSLVRMGMGPSDAESVAILLSASCRLRSLILSANAIGDSGVSIVLSALSSNVSLRS